MVLLIQFFNIQSDMYFDKSSEILEGTGRSPHFDQSTESKVGEWTKKSWNSDDLYWLLTETLSSGVPT